MTAPALKLPENPLAGAWRAAVEDAAQAIDPIARLMDPSFTASQWEYEWSRIGLEIPGVLHAKQNEALLHLARHRWLFWGNQAGKSTLGAIDLVLLCLGRHPHQKWRPPVHCWASALTWELWENILLPELLTWIPKERIVDAPEPYRKSSKRDIVIRADNGSLSRITGKAAEQGAERYQSARVHRVWLDEEHPESVWDEMQPRLLRFGGDTIATMTPLKGFTWVYGRIYEPVQAGKIAPERHWFSHAGPRDNPGIKRSEVREMEKELQHNPAQLAARVSGLFVRPVGAVLPFDIQKHGVTLKPEQLKELVPKCRHYGAVDLGKWRFAFVWAMVQPDGSVLFAGETFSQNEDDDARAKQIDTLLTQYDVPDDIILRADNADPASLAELNAALERRSSKYFFTPVDGANKLKKAGILRLESLMNRGALWVNRAIGTAGQWLKVPPWFTGVWRVGQNASSLGKPVEGSRLTWEWNNWQYPKAIDGKIQKDEPDDASADGADACDGARYLVMTWLGPLDVHARPKHKTFEQRVWDDAKKDKSDEEDEDGGEHFAGEEFGDVIREGE